MGTMHADVGGFSIISLALARVVMAVVSAAPTMSGVHHDPQAYQRDPRPVCGQVVHHLVLLPRPSDCRPTRRC